MGTGRPGESTLAAVASSRRRVAPCPYDDDEGDCAKFRHQAVTYAKPGFGLPGGGGPFPGWATEGGSSGTQTEMCVPR
jgi:hypothetical protein